MGKDTLETLVPYQRAIFQAISEYDVAPIDAEHVSISGSGTELRFHCPRPVGIGVRGRVRGFRGLVHDVVRRVA